MARIDLERLQRVRPFDARPDVHGYLGAALAGLALRSESTAEQAKLREEARAAYRRARELDRGFELPPRWFSPRVRGLLREAAVTTAVPQ